VFDNIEFIPKIEVALKMKKNERIAVRLPSKQREEIELLIQSGEFRNLSIAIRTALEEFLSPNCEGRDYFASE
jgi:hypothetical protein